jgi:hypothetical protein
MKTRHATLHRIAIILLSVAAAGQAVAITVTNTSDGAEPGPAGSLRKAINDAAVGDTIDFAVPTEFITLTAGQLLIAKNVTIVGPGARNLTIGGNNASGVFEVAKDVTMNLSGLTLSGGLATTHPPGGNDSEFKSGGAIYNLGNLTIAACRITGNRASSSASTPFVNAAGGGIDNADSGTLTMRDSEISSNVCDANESAGGGLSNVGTANLTNCTVSNNQLLVTGNNFGDAIGAGIYNAGPLNLVNCTINNNYFPTSADPHASGEGGGIYNSSTANLRNTIVAQNSAPYAGPDVYDNSSSDFTSQGHNLIGITDNGGNGWITDPNDPNHDYTGTAAAPLDPGFGRSR